MPAPRRVPPKPAGAPKGTQRFSWLGLVAAAERRQDRSAADPRKLSIAPRGRETTKNTNDHQDHQGAGIESAPSCPWWSLVFFVVSLSEAQGCREIVRCGGPPSLVQWAVCIAVGRSPMRMRCGWRLGVV